MAALRAPWPAAVGVSGGSDSVALMLLLRDWAKAARVPPPLVLCVDHRLRPESQAEARKVVAWARRAGLTAKVLTTPDALPASDLEAAARAMRYRLLGEFARKRRLAAIYVAHTEDDQAETFLLRLARGSGVDGLSAMQSLSPYPHPDPAFRQLALVRPLLGVSRQALRGYLTAAAQPWVEDPMNADPHFHRVRIRQAWPYLEQLGFSRSRLILAAGHLSRARSALEAAALAVLARSCRPHGQGVVLDPAAIVAAPAELALRALASILMQVSGNPYRPRFERLMALYAAVMDGSAAAGRTLHGCRIGRAPKASRLFGNGTLLVQPEKSRGRTGKSHAPGQ